MLTITPVFEEPFIKAIEPIFDEIELPELNDDIENVPQALYNFTTEEVSERADQ